MSERNNGGDSGRPERSGSGERFGRPERSGGERSSNRFDAGTGSGRGGRDRRQEAPSGRAERGERGAARPAWQERVARPIDYENKPKSPPIPDDITEKDLPLGVRAQLKTLTAENAEKVARHLAMVGLLIDQDPELAHKHALAAAERAGRIAMVRETVGITAYRVGDYALALRELLTYRRISGLNDQVPIMVDCERGMGRPDRALELGREVDRSKLDAETRVNLAIAMSGARLDRNENEMALAELEIAELNPAKVFAYSAPLFFAYAETLAGLGRDAEAKRWNDLAERAEKATSGINSPEDEVFDVLEEIEIPVLSDKPRETRDSGNRFGRDRDSSDRSRDDRGRGNFEPRNGFGNNRDRGTRNDR